MHTIKMFFAVLAAVSITLAFTISGKVTDMTGTAISGAIVKLEKGGQADTTVSNGIFILTDGVSIINNRTLQNRLSATIQHGLLLVNVAERSAVAISTFDLTGKALSKVRMTLNAGANSIPLDRRGAGIYLYRVQTSTSSFILKGNSIDCGSSSSAATVLAPSSNNGSAEIAAAINNVIAATKDGYLNYRVIVTNSDTSGIAIKMVASAGTVRDTDGNVYQTIKIGNQTWTVENLRTKRYNDGTQIPLVPLPTAWKALSTPAFCAFNNTTNTDSIKKNGYLYNWYAIDTKKLAPAGWHVPTDAEWETLENYLIANKYNGDSTTTGNKIAKSMAAMADWAPCTTPGTIGYDMAKNNKSGFSAIPVGFRDENGLFDGLGYCAGWWNSSPYGPYAWNRYLFYDSEGLGTSYPLVGCGYPVRLLKN